MSIGLAGTAALAAAVAVLGTGCGGNSGPEMHSHSPEGAKAKTEVKSQEILQKTCPVMGGKIDPKVYAEYKGRRIYFCCPGCEKDFRKDPERYIEKVDEELKKNAT